MSPRDLVFRVLLITIVRFSTASIIRPQRLLIVRLSPKSARSLEDVPDRWRTMHSEFKAPQIEIELLKSHVSPDENWKFTNEYKYSGKDYHGAAKVTPKKDERIIPRIESDDVDGREKKKGNDQDIYQNIVSIVEIPPEPVPQIEFRNIFAVPKSCPVNERLDSVGRCRIVT